MKIDRDLILKLEKLSRLELSEEQRSKMQTDLGKMLGMVEKLDEINLADVDPLLHMTPNTNVSRSDEVRNQMDTKAAMENAPDGTDKYFKVPKVIKK